MVGVQCGGCALGWVCIGVGVQCGVQWGGCAVGRVCSVMGVLLITPLFSSHGYLIANMTGEKLDGDTSLYLF